MADPHHRRPTARAAVVIPLHLDPSDNSGVRVCALGAVFLAMGVYLGVTGRHSGHVGGLVTAVAICLVLATICLGAHPAGAVPQGGQSACARTDRCRRCISSDGGIVAWNAIARVELVKAPIHVAHGRPGPMRRYLQITAHDSHAGSLRVDVTGVAALRGLIDDHRPTTGTTAKRSRNDRHPLVPVAHPAAAPLAARRRRRGRTRTDPAASSGEL